MSAFQKTLFVAGCTLLPHLASAWDAAGHMLIDEIAWKQMTPAARQKASELVKSLDAQFNDNQPYNFITAGAWMDDMRGLGKDYKWAKLHYVDIPWNPTGDPVEVPKPPTVISGIADTLQILGDAQATPAQRTEALGMLIHYVGDIHQPLHATERDHDRGGNSFLITGVPFSDLAPKQGRNLHTFWDKAFRFDKVGDNAAEVWVSPTTSERPKAPGEGIIAQEAGKIMAEFPRQKLPELAHPADATTWATDTFKVGCKSAYPAGDPPPMTEARALTPDFIHESHTVANRQLAIAGYRLGDLLNRLLAP